MKIRRRPHPTAPAHHGPNYHGGKPALRMMRRGTALYNHARIEVGVALVAAEIASATRDHREGLKLPDARRHNAYPKGSPAFYAITR